MFLFQGYTNNVNDIQSNIEVLNSVFYDNHKCAIRIIKDVNLKAEILKFIACFDNNGMIHDYTPSTIGFDGKACNCSFIDAINCNASYRCICFLKTTQYASINDISLSCIHCKGYPFMTSYGSSDVEVFNQSYSYSSETFGALHCGFYPPHYSVKHVNVVKIEAKLAYGQTSSNPEEMLNYRINILNSTFSGAFFNKWKMNHLYDNFAIFNCHFNGLESLTDNVFNIRFTNCYCQSDLSTDGCLITEYTENDFITKTANFNPKRIECSLVDDKINTKSDQTECLNADDIFHSSITFSLYNLFYPFILMI